MWDNQKKINHVLYDRGPYDEDGLISSMDIYGEEYFYAISYLSLFQIF